MVALNATPIWLPLLLLAALIGLGTWFNLRYFATWMAPFILLAVPFGLVAAATWIFGGALGYVSVQPAALWIWLVGLAVFLVGGLPIAYYFGSAVRQNIKEQPPLHSLHLSQWLAIALGWCVIVLLSVRFISMGGIASLLLVDDPAFIQAFGGGLPGHARVLAYLIVTLLIGTLQWRQWIGWVTVVLLLALFTLYTVKSWIYMPLVGGIILRITTGRIRISFTKLLLFGLLATALFFVSYLLTFAARNPASLLTPVTYSNLARHMSVYFFAGILGWSETLRLSPDLPPPDVTYVFRPLYNLIAVLTGAPVQRLVSPDWVSINPVLQAKTNVLSLFGTLSVYLGYPGALLYVLVSSLFLYGLFAWSIIRRNSWILAIWAFLAAPLIFGWFNLYYMHLAFFETSVYGLVLAGFTWLLAHWLSMRGAPANADPFVKGKVE